MRPAGFHYICTAINPGQSDVGAGTTYRYAGLIRGILPRLPFHWRVIQKSDNHEISLMRNRITIIAYICTTHSGGIETYRRCSRFKRYNGDGYSHGQRFGSQGWGYGLEKKIAACWYRIQPMRNTDKTRHSPGYKMKSQY